MKHWLGICWLVWAAGFALATEVPEKPKPDEPSATALLVGGGLRICSSLSTRHCTESWRPDKNALKAITYRPSSERIAHFTAAWSAHFNQPMPAALASLLKRLAHRHSDRMLSKRQFTDLLYQLKTDQGQHGEAVIKALTDAQWYMLLDHHQEPRVDAAGRRIEEQVKLSLSDPQSQQIVQQFTVLSRQVARDKNKQRTTILVSTASASDVFDAVSFYTALFQADAVDVHWLPLEAGLQALWQDGAKCEALPAYRARVSRVHDRQRVYPNLARYQQQMCQQPRYFEQLIQQADGLFFNGGDQSLTLQSLATIDDNGTHYSALYRLIKQRFDQGRLVLAGSSAGTAVMSGGVWADEPSKRIPMVSNGASLYGFVHGAQPMLKPPAACGGELGCDTDVLSYLPSGGFDFLSAATWDTHFSERNRQYRLARLISDTQSPLGIGIDENTAMLWRGKRKSNSSGPFSQWKLEVMGSGAVWLLQHDFQASQKDALSYQLAVLQAGDEVNMQSHQVNPVWRFQFAQHYSLGAAHHPWLKAMQVSQSGTRLHRELYRSQQHNTSIEVRLTPQPAGTWPWSIEIPIPQDISTAAGSDAPR